MRRVFLKTVTELLLPLGVKFRCDGGYAHIFRFAASVSDVLKYVHELCRTDSIEFYFDPYSSNISPTLHVIEHKLCRFAQIQFNMGNSDVPLWPKCRFHYDMKGLLGRDFFFFFFFFDITDIKAVM
jgi:hypothetical protein